MHDYDDDDLGAWLANWRRSAFILDYDLKSRNTKLNYICYITTNIAADILSMLLSKRSSCGKPWVNELLNVTNSEITLKGHRILSVLKITHLTDREIQKWFINLIKLCSQLMNNESISVKKDYRFRLDDVIKAYRYRRVRSRGVDPFCHP